MVVVNICLKNFKHSIKMKAYIIEYQHHNKMVYMKGRIEHFSLWLEVCYNFLNYCLNIGRKQLASLATFKIEDFIDLWAYKPLMNDGMVTNLT